MRRVAEDPQIIGQIETQTGVHRERVSAVVTCLRDVIDMLFLDGYTIIAPPFSLTYANDPVTPVFAARIEDASDAEIQDWYVGDLKATAAWLGIQEDEYLRHPVASELMVLTGLLDGLSIEDADGPEGIEAVTVARAWFDTFEVDRPYQLSGVGLERDLEAWLIHHAERLGDIGYAVRLRHQQLVLPDRRRPDLVFDLIEEDGSVGTLIVELKATGAYREAVDQLVGYMDALSRLGLAAGSLRGLLVADGFPPDVLSYANAKQVDTATLTELGYRRDLADLPTPTHSLPSSIDRPTVGGTNMNRPEKTNADSLPAYFLAWGRSGYDPTAYDDDAPVPRPFLKVIANSISDPVLGVEPVGDPGWEFEVAREELMDGIQTPRHFSGYFGSSCYLAPANAAAERELEEWRTKRTTQEPRDNQAAGELPRRSNRRAHLRADQDLDDQAP